MHTLSPYPGDLQKTQGEIEGSSSINLLCSSFTEIHPDCQSVGKPGCLSLSPQSRKENTHILGTLFRTARGMTVSILHQQFKQNHGSPGMA